jgi:uncharacterized protein YlzI (FlbEa/FlbD family)
MIVLHTIDGREIAINPALVTSMQEARPNNADDKAFVGGLRCMVNLTDGKFVTVVETCEAVRQKMEGR